MTAQPYGPPSTVVLVYFDDLNDWIGPLGGNASVHTPHLNRLASYGMTFLDAHCAAPVCNASRCSVLLGRYPHETGIYGNREWIFDYSDEATLIELLRDAGYRTVGRGKVFHAGIGQEGRENRDERRSPVWDDYWFAEARHTAFGGAVGAGLHAHRHEADRPRRYHEFDWGTPTDDPTLYRDHIHVDSAMNVLRQNEASKLCLAVGLDATHIPWYAPREYFDLYPIDSISIPNWVDSDDAEIPEFVRRKIRKLGDDHALIAKHDLWREAIQAYQAVITFMDYQVGRLLDQIDKVCDPKDTLVVALGDHGFHLGEKLAWRKSTLWEEATRVPLIMRGWEVPEGVRCKRIVSLPDVFSTMSEIAVPANPVARSAISFLPLLRDPDRPWRRHALTTWKGGNHSVRSEHYRYTRYENGAEELFDHRKDPEERKNCVVRKRYAWTRYKFSMVLRRKINSNILPPNER